MATPHFDAVGVFEEIVSRVEEIRNDEHTFVDLAPGDDIRQGDIYVVRIDDPDGGSALKVAGSWPSRRIALGSSQGSRHVVLGDCDVFIPDEASAIAVLNRLIPATKGHVQFLGPLIRARGPVRIAHPEHGDRTLPGPADYLVAYQRSWADEIRGQVD